MERDKIRNFCIIAHIDHGKSTLADRILDVCHAVTEREKKDQILDSMDLERERGITIKLNAVELKYKGYLLHLIDTPGHVDFSYEVSRSLAACEGTILVVDATQGIEAQTLANLYLALDANLKIIPVINKIDLPNADPEKVANELVNTIGFERDEIILCSGKTGEGVETLLDAVIEKIPAPTSDSNKLRALIFDSYFDPYKGVVVLIRVVDGCVKIGDKVRFINSNVVYEVLELGKHTPHEVKKDKLESGEVGFLSASIKSITEVEVGDTICIDGETVEALPGYKPMKPMVFSGLYPIDSSKYNQLKEALLKLKLSDASLVFEPETSVALGFGFRCGFLGLLHMEIIEERIEREFGIDIIATSPSVIYEVIMTDGTFKAESASRSVPQVCEDITAIPAPVPLSASGAAIFETSYSFANFKSEKLTATSGRTRFGKGLTSPIIAPKTACINLLFISFAVTPPASALVCGAKRTSPVTLSGWLSATLTAMPPPIE